MRLKEFQDLLDRFGGDPMAWPADLRPGALALAQTSPDAFRLLRETQELERTLVAGRTPEPSPDAVDRVMERIRAHEDALASAAHDAPEPEARMPLPAILAEVGSVLGGFIYRPVLLITMASLIGVVVGVVDRTADLQETYSGLMYFIMTL